MDIEIILKTTKTAEEFNRMMYEQEMMECDFEEQQIKLEYEFRLSLLKSRREAAKVLLSETATMLTAERCRENLAMKIETLKHDAVKYVEPLPPLKGE